MKRKITPWLTLAAAGMLVAATGCSAQSTNADDSAGGDASGPRIALFMQALISPYSQTEVRGAQDAVDAAGGTLDVFDGNYSGDEQLKQIQDALATGNYDGFIVEANDSLAVVPGVEEAADSGIPTVAAYSPIGPDLTEPEPQINGVVATVWHPNVGDGEALAEMAVQACETNHPDADPCKVAHISGGNTQISEVIKLKAFTQVLEDAPINIELVAQQEGNWDVGESRNAAANILQANPDLDVLVASGDQMLIGGEQGVEDSGKAGQVSLIGVGASEEGVERVRAGSWFGTTVFLPYDAGRLYAETLLEYLENGEVASTVVDVLDHSTVGRVYTQLTTEDFEPQWTSIG